MARMHSSLKSTHLLMWSSPILLVVLVFTLTSSSSPATKTTASTSSTTIPASTTTVRASTVTTTTTKPRSSAAIAPVENNYVNVTSSTVSSVAPAPSVSPSSGVLAGELTRELGVVDVPLQGPGTWTLATTASTRQTLNCGPQTIPASTHVVVGVNQSCQLEITATAAGTTLAWQLTPLR